MRQTFDRRSVLGICVGSAAGAALLASGAPSYAATTTFKADLKGASEVPPNTDGRNRLGDRDLRSGDQGIELQR